MFRTSLPPAHALARFQLLSSPLVPPGKCAVCGTPSRPVVDFGMTLEFYGAVYLCTVCLTEAGRAINMVTAEEFARAEADSSLSFEEQLNARGMKAISNERYDSLAMAITAISDALLPADDSGIVMVAGQTAETSPTLLDVIEDHEDGGDRLVFKIADSAIGDTEQDDNSAVGEGSSSVSSDNKHGSNFDF